jgi:hypothetical protein
MRRSANGRLVEWSKPIRINQRGNSPRPLFRKGVTVIRRKGLHR